MNKEFKDDNGVVIQIGDIIQFNWYGDSCWGKEGKYKGYVTLTNGVLELVYIDRKKSTYSKYSEITGKDELESLLKWSEDIEIIGNINKNIELLERYRYEL